MNPIGYFHGSSKMKNEKKILEAGIVYQELKKSRKYKYLCEETLNRISEWALERYEGKKAVKAAKNKLHQVYGAYFETFQPGKIQKLLEKLSPGADADTLKSVAVEIMKSQSSTDERLPFMERFYNEFSGRIEPPRKILDLACGMNPFAVQWMNLERGVEYHAYDIDTRLIAVINTFFGYLSPSYKAHKGDLLVTRPGIEADVVFLLKALPCLEQQEKGVGEKIIASLKAKHVVISFPSKSLSGKIKGMENYYHRFALEFISRRNWRYFKLGYPNEIFYVIDKK